jgi:RNA polymerase sigma-70 factor (ECF subfamily)
MTRPDKATQQELILRAQDGNADAFGQLVTHHQQAVYNIAYRLTGNRQEAEDVAQEAFVKTYRTLDRFDSKRPFAPWLYRITTNTALNWIKRRRPEAELDEELASSNTTPTPETLVITAETGNRLRTAIAELPPNYRAVIELRHFQGLSYHEMSEALNAPLSDVKSWLFRARRRLRKTLTQASSISEPEAV